MIFVGIFINLWVQSKQRPSPGDVEIKSVWDLNNGKTASGGCDVDFSNFLWQLQVIEKYVYTAHTNYCNNWKLQKRGFFTYFVLL